MKHNKKAFTLVELLVVVLIIGILSAIAIPMYQGAVDKSHWSTMLPASKAIKDAEEAIKMTNGYYTTNMDDLDVRMNSTDLDVVLDIKDSLSEPNVIRVTNSKLGNKVRLASYLDDSPKFAGQLHCEAENEGSTPNARGQRLCEKLLNGQYLRTTDDGYTRYLLDQSIDKNTCGAANLVWSNKQTNCYKTEKDRCEANGMPYANGVCGCTTSNGYGECSYTTFTEAECNANGVYTNGCIHSTFEYSVCNSNGHGGCEFGEFYHSVCNADKRDACQGSKFYEGSKCVSADLYACGGSTFYAGSRCIANTSNAACHRDTKYEGGCCEGEYCPSWAPKCDD